MADEPDANPGDGIAQDQNNVTTLRAAIMEGNALGGSHSIGFSSAVFLNGGYYIVPLLKGQLKLTAGFTINGPTTTTIVISPIFPIIPGQPQQEYRIMEVDANATVTINRLTLSGGKESNDAGGGILNKGILTVQDSKIVGCSATSGGAISNHLELNIIRSHLEHNEAVNGEGGAIFAANVANCTTTITDSFLLDNDSGKGGAITLLQQATVTTYGTEFRDNTCSGPGGAVYNSGGTFTMNGGKLEHNEALEGGGLYNSGGTSNLNSVLVKLNDATAWGGGVHAKTGTTNITGCTFDQNAATVGGSKVAYEGALGVLTFINIDATCIDVTPGDRTLKQ